MHVLGRPMPIMLPYSVIKFTPFLSNARCPSRLIVFVYLFWAIIVALALKYFLNTHINGKKKMLLLTLLIVLLFADYYSPCSEMTKVELPPCYEVIQREGDTFAILDLPGGGMPNESYMMYQTLHGIPLVQGYLARKIGKSLIDYLDKDDLTKQKEQLKKHHVRYIIVHKYFISKMCPLDISQYEKIYRSIYEDKQNIVYQVY